MSVEPGARLYERVAESPSSSGQPYWMLNAGVTFFAGPLHYNAPHQHGAPVFLSGLHGPFGLRLAGSEWQTCRTAMIPAGLSHELEVGGNPIGVLYVDGDRGDTLAALVSGGRESGGGVVGSGCQPLLREIFEDGESGGWASEALDDLLRFATKRQRREPDARVRRSLDLLARDEEGILSAAACARRLGLSSSRFQHLFTSEMGVPFRRYRAWLRMRRAIGEVVGGANFTGAAHAAGFSDQAHFAHDFRRTFGAPASMSLRALRR